MKTDTTALRYFYGGGTPTQHRFAAQNLGRPIDPGHRAAFLRAWHPKERIDELVAEGDIEAVRSLASGKSPVKAAVEALKVIDG